MGENRKFYDKIYITRDFNGRGSMTSLPMTSLKPQIELNLVNHVKHEKIMQNRSMIAFFLFCLKK